MIKETDGILKINFWL